MPPKMTRTHLDERAGKLADVPPPGPTMSLDRTAAYFARRSGLPAGEARSYARKALLCKVFSGAGGDEVSVLLANVLVAQARACDALEEVWLSKAIGNPEMDRLAATVLLDLQRLMEAKPGDLIPWVYGKEGYAEGTKEALLREMEDGQGEQGGVS